MGWIDYLACMGLMPDAEVDQVLGREWLRGGYLGNGGESMVREHFLMTDVALVPCCFGSSTYIA